MDTEDHRIPVTLLTGFLGAGKTTLLNTMIRDPNAGRIAVIMNEFGDVGLDHDLIEAATEETILLESGCLCCSIRGDLATTLSSLMERKKQGALAFDRVVIETTGIADPGPVLHTLVVSPSIAPDYRMDGVITLADCATGPDTLDQHLEAVHQIAIADAPILTKTDLVSDDPLCTFEARVQAINPDAPRIKAAHGRVPLTALFGLSAMRSGAKHDDILKWLGQTVGSVSQDDPAAAHIHDSHDHDHHHDHHDGRITSASIQVYTPIAASVFDFWLDMLIALKGPDILRMKGIVHVEDMDKPFVFHGVQHIFDRPVPLETWEDGPAISRIVVIARDMTEAELHESLKVLRMQPKDTEETSHGMLSDTVEMPF